MKNSMIGSFRRWAVLGIGSVLLPAMAFGAGEVLNPAKRQEFLDQAKKLLAPREAPAMVADPFHSEAFAEVIGAAKRPQTGGTVATEPVGPRSPRSLLEAIAANLKPSGNFVFGGQPTLVFGQKRVKAGGTLTITFEGAEFTIEITAIERTNFTLRLNREEFTRPIK